MTRSTTFEQEVTEISKVRKLRRSQIKKYPSVSVVIATLRENDLENILQQMAQQTLPKFEIWLGLHEIELNPRHKTLIKRLNTRGIKVSSKKFPKSATLGEVLTQISNLTTGELVAKIDDDNPPAFPETAEPRCARGDLAGCRDARPPTLGVVR